jgi:cyclase
MKLLIPSLVIFLISSNLFAYGADTSHQISGELFKSTIISENVFLLQGEGGNIALLRGNEGLVLIDAGYAKMSKALDYELVKHGGVDEVVYLINTHWHADHTEGNAFIGDHAPIIAHKNVRSRLLTRQEVKFFNMVSEPYASHAIPSITFDKAIGLSINGETLEVIHFANGHTDGDSVVFLKSANIVHMGDHFFSGFYPFIDVDTGGNVRNMANNIKSILARIDDETIVIPGHGPLSSKADLEEFHQMLVETTAEVEAMLIKGMTAEEIQAEGLSLEWEDWSAGYLSTDAWIKIVIRCLNTPMP